MVIIVKFYQVLGQNHKMFMVFIYENIPFFYLFEKWNTIK